jgi:hypothetical protein
LGRGKVKGRGNFVGKVYTKVEAFVDAIAQGAPIASIYDRGPESSDVYADADEIDARIEA